MDGNHEESSTYMNIEYQYKKAYTAFVLHYTKEVALYIYMVMHIGGVSKEHSRNK